MKKFLSILTLLFAFFFSYAQDKTFELDRLMDRTLYPKTLQSLQFIPNTNAYSYIADKKIKIVQGHKTTELLDITDLNALLKAKQEKELLYIPEIAFISSTAFTFQANSKLYQVDITKKELQILSSFEKGIDNIDIETTNNKSAYTKENNLYVLVNGKEIPLSSESNKNIVYGQKVHREEFGISKGTFWSPKGNLLAFYRMDQTMVTDYPLVNTATRIAQVEPFKYPMAGTASHWVTVGVYNTATGKTLYLNTLKNESLEEKESYLTNITWSPDEKHIYIAKLNRKQNHMQLNCYSAETGEFLKTLFEEKNDKYVEPFYPLYFIPTKSNEFLYLSQRDGYMHIYHYNTNGHLIAQLTKGEWLVKNIVSFNTKGTEVFFYATKENPTETHLYSVDVKTAKIEKITQAKGTHTVLINDKGDLFLDTYSNRNISSETLLLNRKGKTISTILKNEDILKGYKLPEIDIFTIKAADNTTDLYCRMIKPTNFDKNKKYPAIVYVYGGPHAQLITESWLAGSNLYFMFLAQQGYVVWTVDSRGSANRGFEFESAIHKQLGDVECADQMKGVEYLKTQKYVDTNRIAVDGWSYGGFMTISLKLRYPKVFKVATAGGPVIDWKWYEVMYGERYASSPNDNEEGYKKSSTLTYIPNLEGKLMVIHGAQDPTVVWQHSLQFIDECIKKKKQVDYFVYPSHAHNVRGLDRLHLWRKLYDYYQQNL